MSTPPSESDFIPIATETTIMLSNTSTQWAAEICQTVTDIGEQWHSFLRALAITGFEQWLDDSSVSFTMTYPRSAAPTADTYVQVGEFRLCILPMGAFKDMQVTIPATVISGDHKAHLYILLNVYEEVEQVQVVAGLRHDQLVNYLKQDSVPVSESYAVPVEQFTVRPEKLLWYLSCLEPEAIIPAEETELPRVSISDSVKSATAQVINTAQWLQGQLDSVAEQLAWQFMPSLTLSYGMRGTELRESEDPLEKLTPILERLQQQGVEIPSEAVGAAKRITVGETVCQVYTLLWELPETQEWSLFVLLGPAGQQPLPPGMVLQVSDQTAVMSRRELRHDSVMTFLYIQAIGNLDEQFVVEISEAHGVGLTLSQFGYDANP